jgi:hypothetical protein
MQYRHVHKVDQLVGVSGDHCESRIGIQKKGKLLIQWSQLINLVFGE